MSSHKIASSKSSHKSASENNVEKAFSKLEDSLSKVQETMPKLELALPALNGLLFNSEPAKKIAQWYIDTAEDFANHGIELQEKSTIWTQGTPWAPLFRGAVFTCPGIGQELRSGGAQSVASAKPACQPS